jgi:F-type H+-transporting ATPase subunit b
MDMLINVFTSLGVDYTVFIQFGIFVVLFAVLKVVWFKKLREVIIERENQTVKLQKNSEDINREALNLQDKYNDLLSEVYAKAQDKLHEEKDSITEELQKKYKSVEKEVHEVEEEEIKKVKEELSKTKDQIFSEKENLTNQLISKLSN